MKAEGRSAQHGLDFLARELMEVFLPNVSVHSSPVARRAVGKDSAPLVTQAALLNAKYAYHLQMSPCWKPKVSARNKLWTRPLGMGTVIWEV